jgi:hypothetical protein
MNTYMAGSDGPRYENKETGGRSAATAGFVLSGKHWPLKRPARWGIGKSLFALATHLFLHLAYSNLGFALDLLGDIAFDRADDIIGLAAKLLGLPGGYIFTSHENLRG